MFPVRLCFNVNFSLEDPDSHRQARLSFSDCAVWALLNSMGMVLLKSSSCQSCNRKYIRVAGPDAFGSGAMYSSAPDRVDKLN